MFAFVIATPLNIFQVHIDNAVYISKTLWENKFSKSTEKHSIVVKDLAGNIWGHQKCAQMSVYGGISPKNPDAEKPAAPPGAIEAILGTIND